MMNFWDALQKRWLRIVEKLQYWLRVAFGIEPRIIEGEKIFWNKLEEVSKFAWAINRSIHGDEHHPARLHQIEEKIKTIEIGQNGLEIKDAKLEALIGDTAQGLQQQISELASLGSPITSGKPPQSEEVQIQPGHVPWSQRKRNYEASKRMPLETPTTQQIKENARIIASGTRKSDKDA